MNKSFLYGGLIVIGIIFGITVGFFIPTHYSRTGNSAYSTGIATTTLAENGNMNTTASGTGADLTASASANAPVSTSAASGPDLSIFNAVPRDPDTSNVVGYFSYGAFTTSLPDWLVQNWSINDSADGSTVSITPRTAQAYRDYSDITMDIATTTEAYNADTLYESNLNNQYISEALSICEVFLNQTQDVWIYHIERTDGNAVDDTFYLDGNGKTAVIHFSADHVNYWIYETRVRQFVEGLANGEAPRG